MAKASLFKQMKNKMFRVSNGIPDQDDIWIASNPRSALAASRATYYQPKGGPHVIAKEVYGPYTKDEMALMSDFRRNADGAMAMHPINSMPDLYGKEIKVNAFTPEGANEIADRYRVFDWRHRK